MLQMASEDSDVPEAADSATSSASSATAEVAVAEQANAAGNAAYRDGHFEAACEFYTSALGAAVDEGGVVDEQRLKRQSASACRSKYYANRYISARERSASLIGKSTRFQFSREGLGTKDAPKLPTIF